MRIGIDCRLWSVSTGRYVRELIAQLSKLDHENEYVLFLLKSDFDKPKVPANFKKVVANVWFHSFGEQIVMPILALKERLDVYHVPYINVPIFYPKKFICTIHDLTIMRVNTGRASTRHFLFYQMKRLGFRIAIWFCVFRSAKIITVTEFVKQDILKTFKVSPDKIIVARNGVAAHFVKQNDEQINKAMEVYNIKKPYLFYVGNAHPHKNVEGLLKAFEIVSKEKPDLTLVLGGDKYFFYERLEREWGKKPIFSKLNFAGFIDDEILPAVYTGAELFVNPSKFEGFGLQLLEAFSCGTRVASSNRTSLPEVGGDAAYYFDPDNYKQMAEVILKALNDKSDEKLRLGYEQIKKFSWENSAKIHLKTYENSFSS